MAKYSWTCPNCCRTVELRKRVTLKKRTCSYCGTEITIEEIDNQAVGRAFTSILILLFLGMIVMVSTFVGSGPKTGDSNSPDHSSAEISKNNYSEVPRNAEQCASQEFGRERVDGAATEVPVQIAESQSTTGQLEVEPADGEQIGIDNLKIGSAEETITRTLRRHFSNMAIDTEESWMSAYADFSKTWQSNHSLDDFSSTRGSWVLKDGWQKAIIRIDLMDENRANVDVALSYFTDSNDVQRVALLVEHGSWKIDSLISTQSSHSKDSQIQP